MAVNAGGIVAIVVIASLVAGYAFINRPMKIKGDVIDVVNTVKTDFDNLYNEKRGGKSKRKRNKNKGSKKLK
jgi:hypothetical protein